MNGKPKIYTDEQVTITIEHNGQKHTTILSAHQAEQLKLVKIINKPSISNGEYTEPYMGLSEAATYLEVSPQYMSAKISKREDFPRPICTLKCGPIWSTADIVDYKGKHE